MEKDNKELSKSKTAKKKERFYNSGKEHEELIKLSKEIEFEKSPYFYGGMSGILY